MTRAIAKETKPKLYLQKNQQPNSNKFTKQTNTIEKRAEHEQKYKAQTRSSNKTKQKKTSKIIQTNNYSRNDQSCSRINKTQRTNLNNETAKTPNKQTTIGEVSRAKAKKTRSEIDLQTNLNNKTAKSRQTNDCRRNEQSKSNKNKAEILYPKKIIAKKHTQTETTHPQDTKINPKTTHNRHTQERNCDKIKVESEKPTIELYIETRNFTFVRSR